MSMQNVHVTMDLFIAQFILVAVSSIYPVYSLGSYDSAS